MKKVLKILLILLIIVVVAFVGLLGMLTITEYRPADTESLEVRARGDPDIVPPGQLTVLSWNIGYAGLGKNEDFFMDGGSTAKPKNADVVNGYLEGIRAAVAAEEPDFVLFQEVDSNSSRTHSIDETVALQEWCSAYAMNYSCPFVPVPFPPMGKVHSGLLTTTDYVITEADRIALPCPFSWPLRTANLKRCLLVSRLPVAGSDKQLVLVNLHLEAYDDGEGKLAQTTQLMDFLKAEYDKGNYVIAGGDFNQTFPGGLDYYPVVRGDFWAPGTLEGSMLPEGFGYAYDLTVPSCRLLNQPYNPADTENTQYYVIDGFIVSPNIVVHRVETLNLGFENSDHNPVSLTFTFG